MKKTQAGVAALTITLIILLIATLGVMYANKSSFLFQKNSSNIYQYEMALQAAEYGVVDIMPILFDDLEKLKIDPDDASTVFLEKNTTPPSSTSCSADPSSSSFYKLKKTNSAKNIELISGTGHTPGLAYNVLLNIVGSKITATSAGCTGNTKSDGSVETCSEVGNANAIVRRVIDLGSTLTPAKSAISSKGYIDINTTLTVDLDSGKTVKANCGVLFGEGGKDKTDSTNCDTTVNATTGEMDNWKPELDPKYCLSTTYNVGGGFLDMASGSVNKKTLADKSLKDMTDEAFFASYFGGMSKAEVKASATLSGMVISPARCPTASEATAIRAAATKILWLEGDLNLTSSCVSLYSAGNDITMIVNGDIKGPILGGGSLSLTDTFLYTNNLYQNAPIKITNGSLALAGNWDIDTLGKEIKDYWGATSYGNNTMKDALSAVKDNRDNKTAKSSIHVSYKPIKVVITTASSDKKPDNWIDY